MKAEDIETQNYWTQRYKNKNTGWDIGYPSTPLKTYFNQIGNRELKILIPGAGNAYEAEYLYDLGFKNIFILDISKIPLEAFKKRNPTFPENQLIQDNFFTHDATYDLIIEQTFFCSFPPIHKTRKNYAKQMSNLLNTNGKLVGLWFNIPLSNNLEKRPFGGDKTLYLSYLEPYFKVKTFEKCYNSIPNRNELFGVFLN
ncbi:methyltransferase domain-containing protein [Lacinutrix sp.]|uniref:methyltransferase domain-containing protein n=1 Tax=Lacinutrix sp. TaxID=1937692 RepID=UPI0025BC6729|nr:methyltransferase domain-containing protein [Lacinutrix sp.]